MFFSICQASTYAFHMCNLLQVEKSTFFLLLWLLPTPFDSSSPPPVFLLLVLRLLIRVQLSLPERPLNHVHASEEMLATHSSSNLEQTRVLSSQRRSLFCIIYVKYAYLSVNNHSARLFGTSATDLFHFFKLKLV